MHDFYYTFHALTINNNNNKLFGSVLIIGIISVPNIPISFMINKKDLTNKTYYRTSKKK